MKKYLIAGMFLILAGVVAAGCTTGSTGGQNASVTPTLSTGGVRETTVAVTTTQPPSPLEITISRNPILLTARMSILPSSSGLMIPPGVSCLPLLPLNDDPQYCWFEMTVTNLDSQKSQTYGFGRTYAYDTYQQYPMYTTGPYKIEMKGNLVKVDLDVAKRLP